MPIRLLVLALLLGGTCASAAPPKDTPVAPEDIDVDALVRAKDVDAPKAAATDQAGAFEDAVEDGDTAQPVADSEHAEAALPVESAQPATDATAAAASAQPTQAPATTSEQATSPAAAAAQDADRRRARSCEAHAKNLLDAAEKGDYANATRDFDAKMRAALPAAKFKAAWQSLAQFGALTARGQSHLSKGEGYIAVSVPLIFEKANLYAQVACNNEGKIAGFYVKPLELPAS